MITLSKARGEGKGILFIFKLIMRMCSSKVIDQTLSRWIKKRVALISWLPTDLTLRYSRLPGKAKRLVAYKLLGK